MHVLVTTDTLGGVWTYTRELVTGLAKRDIRVTLVSFGNIPTEEQMKWLEGLTTVDFRPTGFPLEWMQQGAEQLRASAEYLQSVIAETGPDILHLSQYFYGSLRTSIPKVVVAHSDVIGWFRVIHGAEDDSIWMRQYRRFVTSGLEGADVVVAPSAWMLESLRSNYRFKGAGVVIHNGRSPGLFNHFMTKDDYFASMGRIWDVGKNAAILTQIRLPAMLHLAGENNAPDGRGDAAFASRDERLVLRGVLNERQLQHLLSRASIYVASSRYEPFGLALLEAALSRCAILANDIPSFRELWGDSIRYFETNDAASLEYELQQLHRDRELRLTYGKCAYDHAISHYRADAMVDGYVKLYGSLVAREALAA
jgi:glycosyltransferase involved in cell wall biosynthesis